MKNNDLTLWLRAGESEPVATGLLSYPVATAPGSDSASRLRRSALYHYFFNCDQDLLLQSPVKLQKAIRYTFPPRYRLRHYKPLAEVGIEIALLLLCHSKSYLFAIGFNNAQFAA